MPAPLLNPYLDLWQVLRRELSDETLLQTRKKLIWAYSWAIPSDEAIRELANRGPLIEIGAGTGYWSWLCAQAGADVMAFDENASAVPHWFGVKQGCENAIAEFPDRNLLLCWPPLDEAMAFQALRIFKGNTCFYVGEMGGRTASKEFHAELERRYTLAREIKIPQWTGFKDSLFVFERKGDCT